MGRHTILLLLLPLVEQAVMFVEEHFGGAAGRSKRMRAFKYVLDRIEILTQILGPLDLKIEPSTVLGMIDSAVLSRNLSGEFETDTEPAYSLEVNPVLVWTDPAGKKQRSTFNEETGELEGEGAQLQNLPGRADHHLANLVDEVNPTIAETPAPRTVRRPAAKKK